MAAELNLDAFARQIVLNSVVTSYDDSLLKLTYLAELDVMLKPEIKLQIKQAIEDKLGVSLSLEFESALRLDSETPQQADTRKQEQDRLDAIREIQQDPVVMQITETFGAELILPSVKKRLEPN